QNFRRQWFPLWRSPLSIPAKIMATHYLAQYLPQVWMLLLLLLIPPLLLLDALPVLPLAPLGFISLIPPLLYVVSQKRQGVGWLRRLLAFPVLLLVGTGLIARNSLAVLRGLFGSTQQEPTFLRTPKFSQNWQHSEYALRSHMPPLVEIFLALYALWGAGLALNQSPALVPYLLLYAAAFSVVAAWEWLESRMLHEGETAARMLAKSGND
ncbi:MAG: hypothetical protein KC496_13755, partial [Anaerolineae bacterium]|nr:hypothetical protein [Anaerolineae bacterium]